MDDIVEAPHIYPALHPVRDARFGAQIDHMASPVRADLVVKQHAAIGGRDAVDEAAVALPLVPFARP